MISFDINAVQRDAVEASFDACVAITGAPGTGKSTALRLRAERAARTDSYNGAFIAAHPDALLDLARTVLQRANEHITLIDDVEAELVFAQAAQPLFQLEWEEFASGVLDPEVPGLRSPDRFLESAFRLFRKLRDAAIEPREFLERSLAGATNFYAKPPNFAHPELMLGTKETYRDSLDVNAEELQRQYRREIDLAKILARLYDVLVETMRTRSLATPRDGILRASDLLRATPSLVTDVRRAHPLVFVDEAQEATLAQLRFLEALYGTGLNGVTLAGDASAATSTFRGARPDRAFAPATLRFELREQYRSPAAIEVACRRLCADPTEAATTDVAPAITLHRAKTQRDEAVFIADSVREALASGVPPESIALIFRSVADVHLYERALLDRGIPAIVAGDRNIFTDERVLDALALLWNVWDPFRHEWMLRTISGHALALSDASIALLCSEPPSAQTALFAFDQDQAPTARSGRWDPKRDLRLGWNVVRGEQDASLGDVARERLLRFRALREGWIEALHRLPFPQFVRRVWSEGLASEGADDAPRTMAQRAMLTRLLQRLEAYREHNPSASLGDILQYAQARAASDLEACEDIESPGFVRILSIDAARGRSFAYTILPDARAGSFPRWYVPDAFMFSPSLGMIPKDNVGEARASRTAKFSYYIFRTKAREQYNAEERRAFVYAMRRSSGRLLVTASERATRGTTAPEFLEELRNARMAGVVVTE